MSRPFIVAVAAVASALALSLPAEAQATRTWVSGVGDDVNPCSRTAPCKTFAGAISKTAAGGVISVLDPGGYGVVTITKSITIDGGGVVGSILSSGTNGVIINAGAADEVWLRHLSIDGAGTGINGIRVINSTGSVHIDDVSITDVSGRCIDVQPTSAMIYITNTHASACAGGALYIQNARAAVVNFTSESSQYGVRVGPSGIATVKQSSASGGSMGFAAANDPSAVLNLEDSVSTSNDFGVVAGQGATLRCSRVTIMSNRSVGVYNDGMSTLVSFGNNFVFGNPTNGIFSTGVAPQ
jgi:hypothetical protein